MHLQAPGIAAAQVHLLQVLVQAALGEQVLLAQQFLGQQRHLRQLGRTRDARRRRAVRQRIAVGHQVVAAQAFVAAQQLAHVLGHVGVGGGFAGDHVRIEGRRAAHGLAGVVDDEIQPVAGGQQGLAEGFHAGRVAQVQAEHLEAVAPLAEIRLLGVTRGGIARETRGDDQRRPRAQQLQASLVTNLHPAAGEQRHAPAQVGGFGALVEIELGAGRAHLVVEVVDARVLLLAHVAVLRLDGLAHGVVGDLVHRRLRGREIVRRREHRLAAQLADAGGVEHGVVVRVLLLHAFAAGLAAALAVVERVGVVEAVNRGLQALLLGFGQGFERGLVGRHGFQQFGGGAQALDQGLAAIGRSRGGIGHEKRVESRRGCARGGLFSQEPPRGRRKGPLL